MVENPSKALEELRERFAGYERMHPEQAYRCIGFPAARTLDRHREWYLLGEFCPAYWPKPADDDGAEI